MVYTEIKEVGGKKYYYRVKSVRKDGKVAKERKYLGVDLQKKKLGEAEKEADKELMLLENLLSKKEIVAVLLHEIAHIKNRTSVFKIASFFTRIVSPLARFTTFSEELSKEESRADDFAFEIQKTYRHINSAKRKIDRYNASTKYDFLQERQFCEK